MEAQLERGIHSREGKGPEARVEAKERFFNANIADILFALDPRARLQRQQGGLGGVCKLHTQGSQCS